MFEGESCGIPEPTADPSTPLLPRISCRDDKERVVTYLGCCDWDV